MNEFFREKYGEIILNKQKSLSEYQSAINSLHAAFSNKLNQTDDAELISNEFAKSIHNTLNELEKLQVKKINMQDDHPVQILNNLSNFRGFMQSSNSTTDEETENTFLQSFKSQQKNPTTHVAAKGAQNNFSKSLESQQKGSSAVSKDTQDDFSEPLEPVKQSISSVNLEKKQTIKTLKKKKPSLKVTIKNDAPLPPPWIHR